VDLKLKQRLIGAVIIISLAIIILPILLDGNQEERIQLTRRVPPPPAIEVAPFNPADLKADMDRIEQESARTIPQRSANPVDSESLDAQALALDSDGLPVAWSLQVAAFQSEENAVRLREELRDRGYQSYRVDGDSEEGPVSRVLVGPALQRASLERIQHQIEEEFGLKGKIIRYDSADDRNMVGGS